MYCTGGRRRSQDESERLHSFARGLRVRCSAVPSKAAEVLAIVEAVVPEGRKILQCENSKGLLGWEERYGWYRNVQGECHLSYIFFADSVLRP
jgi:hypothetical protein